MDYKAFVSSTYLDLKDHRAHVIRALEDAGFFVDPMEKWTSDANEPKVLSTERLEGFSKAKCCRRWIEAAQTTGS